MTQTKTTTPDGARQGKPRGEAHVSVGAGGEWHQSATSDQAGLTTNQGLSISDNQNSLRANPHGPTLLEDFILREKRSIAVLYG
jgi:catalase